MADTAVASRYARALLELALEEKKVDQFGADLDTFNRLLAQDNGLLGALSHPGFTPTERAEVLDRVLAQLGLDAHVGNFFRIVLQKGRFALVPHVVRSYQEQADEVAGRLRARITSAVPIGPVTSGEIRSSLEQATGRKVVLDMKVDPSIIGGIVAQVGGQVIDGSLRSRLQNVRQQLLNANPELLTEA
jgi:F-type H+-transporting ATPase subunit delta